MALDMYAGHAREQIAIQDEFIFAYAGDQPLRFPQLLDLQSKFYADPSLSPAQADALLHELIDLWSSHGGADNQGLTRVVNRLLVFFSLVVREQADVRCVSD